MSKTQLDRFLSRLAEDEALRTEFGRAHLSPAKIVELAEMHGYQFTAQHLLVDTAPLTDDTWTDAARRFHGDETDNYIVFLEEAPMSKEALNAFFKKVADDEALQKKLIEFAAAQGFEFSADELNDADLDGVAGGLLASLSPDSIAKLRSYLDGGLTYDKVENLTSIQDDGLIDHKVENLTDF